MTNLPFSKQDFIDLNLGDVLGDVDRKDILAYTKVFRNLLETATTESRTELIRILTIIVSDRLELDSWDGGPFEFVDHFGPDLLTFFGELIDEVSDHELRSRIADFLWSRTRDYRIAQLAIDSYLASAAAVEDFEKWPPSQQRLERAVQLASQLGRKNEKYTIVIAAIEDLLDRCNGEDPLFLSAELMRLLQERGDGDPVKYAGFAEKLALAAEANDRFDLTRRYWDAKAAWHLQGKDPEAAREARIKLAESYEKESDFNFANRQPKYTMASHPIEQAIIAYRRTEGCEAKVEELKLKLRDFQTEAVKELATISSGPVDISDIVIAAENAVKDKEFIEALRILAFASSPSDVKAIREKVEEDRKQYLFMTLFPKRLYSATGRSLAVQATEGEEAILADVFQRVGYSYGVTAKGIIEPARRVIVAEHPARMHEFYPLTLHNPLTQPAREDIIVRGLHAGLHGDFLTALHLLIPQFEESIRSVLIARGIVPSSFYESGIQDEFNLNKLLTNAKFADPLKEIFGEDLVFDFRCALVERFGANLRNDLAHGLMDHGAFFSAPAIYAWWLILRFYFLPIRTAESADEPSESPKSVDHS